MYWMNWLPVKAPHGDNLLMESGILSGPCVRRMRHWESQITRHIGTAISYFKWSDGINSINTIPFRTKQGWNLFNYYFLPEDIINL